MALRGRHWAALWLLVFLAAAWVVIARQTAAIRAARDLGALREERANLDRYGTPLALTQETYHVGVAPNELRDPERDGATLARQLHLALADVRQALTRRYAYFAGPFSAIQVQPLRAVHGVHLEAVVNRFYPRPELAHAVIGRVGDGGRGASGLELVLDSVLAGRPGAAVVLK